LEGETAGHVFFTSKESLSDPFDEFVPSEDPLTGILVPSRKACYQMQIEGLAAGFPTRLVSSSFPIDSGGLDNETTAS